MHGSGRIVHCADRRSNGSSRILVLFVIGFFIVFVGIIIITAAAALSGGGSASFGGVIFIGPFPIVFGTGAQATWLILFAIILAALGIIVLLLMRRKMEKSGV